MEPKRRSYFEHTPDEEILGRMDFAKNDFEAHRLLREYASGKAHLLEDSNKLGNKELAPLDIMLLEAPVPPPLEIIRIQPHVGDAIIKIDYRLTDIHDDYTATGSFSFPESWLDGRFNVMGDINLTDEEETPEPVRIWGDAYDIPYIMRDKNGRNIGADGIIVTLKEFEEVDRLSLDRILTDFEPLTDYEASVKYLKRLSRQRNINEMNFTQSYNPRTGRHEFIYGLPATPELDASKLGNVPWRNMSDRKLERKLWNPDVWDRVEYAERINPITGKTEFVYVWHDPKMKNHVSEK